MAKILIVDDEKNIINTVGDILKDEGHIVYPAENGQQAIEFAKKNDVDLIFLDVWLPDMDGLEVLKKIKSFNDECAILMISGHGSIDIAVTATKLGAYDFLQKPISMERVITSASNALDKLRLYRENVSLKQEMFLEDEMIGDSKAIKNVKNIIEKAAKTNARVFITGDNGTGKELVAKAIYQKSSRSSQPFIKVNCAAIPSELIESELFGHEKGAFTGALNKRLGKFELADGGTLFLDEICDMSAAAQAKVLRVLQEQQFERVGGNQTLNVDVRVISATNIDVKKYIAENKFREDLYYRLNVIPIHVPSLKDRKEDIASLIKYFMKKFTHEHNIAEKTFDKEAMGFLNNYSWPGNVRQLKNIIERLVIMVHEEVINLDDVHTYIESGSNRDSFLDFDMDEKSSLKKAREEFEKNYIIQILKKNNKNITATSRELGIERTNLHRKIKQLNIEVDEID